MKKSVIVGVTSSIAIYKSVQMVSDLIKLGYDVEVIMTKNATEFISPLVFSSLTKHNTYVDTFDRNVTYDVKHISLRKKADLFVISPATANVIAKVANGIADDMLTTTFLACDCPKIVCPAMNTGMYENQVTIDNLNKLKNYGIHIVEPASGLLACGDEGKGKLAPIEDIIEAIQENIETNKVLKGKKVLVSAGATIEKIDPVRYISNHSTGKMGYAIARAARNLGAEVYLVSGKTNLKKPYDVNVIDVLSANDMFDVIKNLYEDMDYIIMSAAVADFRPKKVAINKIKKHDGPMVIELEKNQDILAYLGENKTKQTICGFAMETENVIENAKDKLIRKNCDMLVVNNLNTKGAGFANDTNVVSILTLDKCEDLEIMSKTDLAKIIMDKLIEIKGV